MVTNNGYEFKSAAGGEVKFKRLNIAAAKMIHISFIRVTCKECKLPYFKRRSSKAEVHSSCRKYIVNAKKEIRV